MTAADLFGEYPRAVLERFKDFHRDNPHVYERFREHARQMRAAGWGRYSARTIFEVMRWNENLRTRGDAFKVNDDHIPIYARLLIYHHPEFADFFELRKVRSRGRKSEEQRDREESA